MNAWEIEHSGAEIMPEVRSITREQEGPYIASVKVRYSINRSEINLVYELRHGDPNLYIQINAEWLEVGCDENGTPTLLFAMPVNLENPKAVYEIPFGGVERRMEYREEVPALRWAAVHGKADGNSAGCLLLNDSKHGHSFSENVMRLTLIRSSYAPDPYPELGSHEINLAISPFNGDFDIRSATETARIFDHPIRLIGTDNHDGALPPKSELIRWTGKKSILNSIKKAEEDSAYIIKLYNPTGDLDSGTLHFDADTFGELQAAWETDLMERPSNRLNWIGQVVSKENNIVINIPAHGIVSIGLRLDKMG